MPNINQKNLKIIERIKRLYFKLGYHVDIYGNLKNKDNTKRIKFNSLSYRVEVKINTKPTKWLKIGGSYYKDYNGGV